MNLPANTAPRDEIGAISRTLRAPEYRSQIAGSMGVADNDPQVDRFTRVVLRAVQEDPKVLTADRNSLYLACLRAAQDNLIPDGKEGKLVIYSTKVGNGWIDKVQWQPMIGGIRKIAARHGFDIVAHVVHENDDFSYELGDTPHITHKPPKLGKDRGPIIGAYAIATNIESGMPYREVMTREEIDHIAIRSKSKDKEGNLVGPWRDFYGEQARKTVAKRLSKSLPFYDDADDLQGVIARDNEDYATEPEVPIQTAPVEPQKASVRDRMGVVDAPQETPRDDTQGPQVASSDTNDVF